MTPVQATPVQKQLWDGFKSSHLFDVNYNGRTNDNTVNIYDEKGNGREFEKVINKRPVNIQTTMMDMNAHSSEKVIEGLTNPL